VAQQTLPAFPLPSLPQFLTAEIARVDRILAASEVPTCLYESPESSVGACDGGFPCHARATHGEFCARHFQETQ